MSGMPIVRLPGFETAQYLIRNGERLAERMAFWGVIPLFGRLMTAHLAAKLDDISDKIERKSA